MYEELLPKKASALVDIKNALILLYHFREFDAKKRKKLIYS